MNRWLFLILLGLGALVSCNRESATGVRVDSKLQLYVPNTATQMGGVEWNKLVASPFYKRHEGQFGSAVMEDIRNRIGIDPRTDISNVLVTFQNGQLLVLVHGRFRNADVEQRLRNAGAKAADFHGQTLFTSGASAVLFPRDGVAISGDESAVRNSLDSRNGSLAVSLRQQLQNVPSNYQIWFASGQGFPLNRIPVRSDIRSALANISNNIVALNGGIGIDEGLHLRTNLACDSEAGAKRVHDALRGIIGLARLMTRDDQKDMLKVYDAILVDQDHSSVHVHADFNAQEADGLLQMAHLPARALELER